MIFWSSIVVILVISFLWALWSLRSEKKQHKGVHHAKESLSHEKILFKL